MSSFLVGVRLAAVLLSALVLQTAFFANARVAGVSFDLLLTLAIAAGLTGGPERGAVFGFLAGLGVDLLVVGTPFGLAALAYALTGYVTGLLNEAVVRSARSLVILIAIAGGLFGTAVYVVVGELFGEPLFSDPDLLRIAVVVSIGCGLFVLPCRSVMRWAWSGDERSRAALT